MTRKLSPGTHIVRIKTGKGSKTRLQKVRVNAKGQWKFLKNTKKSTSSSSKPQKSSSKKKGNNPSRKVVKRTVNSKMLRTMSLEGGVEDIGWGFIGFTLLGKTPAALPMTRTIQGLAAHALDRRGKARLVPGILDLVSLWLAGGFGSSSSGAGAGVRAQLRKITAI